MAHSSGGNDFIIESDGNEQRTFKQIIKRIVLNELDDNKPMVIVITGKSGSGKTCTGLTIQDIVYEARGLDYSQFVKDTTVINPIEFPIKMDKILNAPELKKAFSVQIDEARVAVSAEMHNSFINNAISHINALSREIKPLLIIVVANSIGRIDKNMRETVDIQLKCRKENGTVFVNPRMYWIDDYNLQKIELRYRKMIGTLKYPDGTSQRVFPIFKPRMVRKEVFEEYKKIGAIQKREILGGIMSKLIDRYKFEMGIMDNDRVSVFAEKLLNDKKLLNMVTKFNKRGGFSFRTDRVNYFGFKKPEITQIEKIINEKVFGGGIEHGV